MLCIVARVRLVIASCSRCSKRTSNSCSQALRLARLQFTLLMPRVLCEMNSAMHTARSTAPNKHVCMRLRVVRRVLYRTLIKQVHIMLCFRR